MIVFRLAKVKYCHDLSGKGAGKTGGRWNSKGVPLVYTSASRALCTIEIAVHIPLGILPSDFKLISINIPDSFEFLEKKLDELPADWFSIPHSAKTQKCGDQFVKDQNYALMKVPSAVVPGEFNFLINPQHADFSKIEIVKMESFSFDERLFHRE